ncbi:MAG TPA: DUF3303 family protein [Dehalococcoidia bacterium]|nr:DUF3303 family protein [Dehalococcoidia bacterium]
MLFHLTHTHTPETCPVRSKETLEHYRNWWMGLKNAPGVKLLSAYASPTDHTIYVAVEAEDFASVAAALGPLNTIGSGHTHPVMSLDDVISMAESRVDKPGHVARGCPAISS